VRRVLGGPHATAAKQSKQQFAWRALHTQAVCWLRAELRSACRAQLVLLATINLWVSTAHTAGA